MSITDIELATRIRSKPRKQPPDFIRDQHQIKIGERVFELRELTDDFDSNLGQALSVAARATAPHWGGANCTSSRKAAEDQVSHFERQTPLKDQLDRPACLSFASIACIEAIFKTSEDADIDLSEQLCNFILEGSNCTNTLFTQNAPAKLVGPVVCDENSAPYEASAQAANHCGQKPNSAGSLFGIAKHYVIERAGLDGPSIINTDYLEYLLELGHDIVLDLRLAGEGMTKVLDVILDPATGEPLRSFNAHVVLVVGYDRTADPQYFLCKSSTGGYWKVSYDYVRVYARVGFIVEAITVETPPVSLRVHVQSCMEVT